jgi:hypothetical protein
MKIQILTFILLLAFHATKGNLFSNIFLPQLCQANFAITQLPQGFRDISTGARFIIEGRCVGGCLFGGTSCLPFINTTINIASFNSFGVPDFSTLQSLRVIRACACQFPTPPFPFFCRRLTNVINILAFGFITMTGSGLLDVGVCAGACNGGAVCTPVFRQVQIFSIFGFNPQVVNVVDTCNCVI